MTIFETSRFVELHTKKKKKKKSLNVRGIYHLQTQQPYIKREHIKLRFLIFYHNVKVMDNRFRFMAKLWQKMLCTKSVPMLNILIDKSLNVA